MRAGTPCILVATILALIVPGTGGAEILTLAPARDNTLFLDVDGLLSSGSGSALFVGNNSASNTRRAVLFYDVGGALPPGAVIESVELRVHVSSSGTPDPRTVQIFRLAASWGEGASVSSGGAGASSEPGDATWIHRFYPDSLWSTPGGDFDPQVRATTTVGDVGSYTFSSPSLASDVQSWLDDPAGNFGWILKGEEAMPSTVKRIDSREHLNSTVRPVLEITFTDPSTPTRRTTWGNLKIGLGSAN